MNYSRLALHKESRCVESSAAQFEGAAKSCSPSLCQQKLGISIPSASVLAAKPNGSRRAPRFTKVAIPRNAFSQVRIRTPAYLDLSSTLASPQHPSSEHPLPQQALFLLNGHLFQSPDFPFPALHHRSQSRWRIHLRTTEHVQHARRLRQRRDNDATAPRGATDRARASRPR